MTNGVLVNNMRYRRGVSGDTAYNHTDQWANGGWAGYWHGWNATNTHGDRYYYYTEQYSGGVWSRVGSEFYDHIYNAQGSLLESIQKIKNTAGQWVNFKRFLYSDFIAFVVADKPHVCKESILAYPSPATTQLSLRTGGKLSSVTAVDAAGRTYPLSLVDQGVNINALKPGLYQLHVKDAAGKVFQTRFVKE